MTGCWLLVLFLGSCVTNAHLAPVISYAPKSEIIPDSYIVVFKDGAHDAFKIAKEATLKANIGVQYWYEIGDFLGFAGTFDEDQLTTVRQMEGIAFIENDAKEYAIDVQTNATWGIDRSDQRTLPLNRLYYYHSTGGEGVNSYILDTGIHRGHVDLQGRATFGACFPSNMANCQGDGHGHGTHVAGTVGSRTYGLAKRTSLISLKCLSDGGSGTKANTIAAMNWSADHHRNTGRTKPSVANLSLGGSFHSAQNAAATAMLRAGVICVVAAGNNGADACNYSPSSAPDAVTAMSTTSSDARSGFSNYGRCTNIAAPGSSITSLAASTSGTRVMSGTSMACPHVAGALASIISQQSTSTTQSALNELYSSATVGRISGLPANPPSPNLLTFTNPPPS